MANFKSLTIWQKSMDLVVGVYRVCRKLPKEEIYVLSNEIRRSAISVPSNIAEGYARRYPKELNRFLSNAEGSLAELETQLLIALRLDYLIKKDLDPVLDQIDHISRMITNFKKKMI